MLQVIVVFRHVTRGKTYGIDLWARYQVTSAIYLSANVKPIQLQFATELNNYT